MRKLFDIPAWPEPAETTSAISDELTGALDEAASLPPGIGYALAGALLLLAAAAVAYILIMKRIKK